MFAEHVRPNSPNNCKLSFTTAMLLPCRVRDIAARQSTARQSIAAEPTSHTAVQLSFPQAIPAQQQSASSPTSANSQHSTAHVIVHSPHGGDASYTNCDSDMLIKAGATSEAVTDVRQEAMPRGTGHTKAHHVTFSEAQVASPTASTAVVSAHEDKEEWTVIQSDGSGSQPASRTGSVTSLIRVKSQVPSGNDASLGQTKTSAKGPAAASGANAPPVKKRLAVKVPKTGRVWLESTVIAAVKSLRTSLPGELRLAPHASSPGRHASYQPRLLYCQRCRFDYCISSTQNIDSLLSPSSLCYVAFICAHTRLHAALNVDRILLHLCWVSQAVT